MSITLSSAPYGYKLPTSAEMAECDHATIKTGIPARQLMERAGRAIFDALVQRVKSGELSKEIVTPHEGIRVAIFSGPGNNGGDGVVVARCFLESGCRPLLVISAAERYSAELLVQLDEFVAKKGEVLLFGRGTPLPMVHRVISERQLQNEIQAALVLIDALLGTAQREAPRGTMQGLVDVLNGASAGRFVAAVDTPTGLNPDSGEVFRPVAADVTFAIELVKRGLVQYPAREWCGEIEALSIGIDCSGLVQFELCVPDRIVKLPQRNPASHKGTFGTVLVLGGSAEMPGAAVLAAHAAIRSGAGKVKKSTFATGGAESWPEIMHLQLPSGVQHFDLALLEGLHPQILASRAVVLGPGIGVRHESAAFVGGVIQFTALHDVPLVLDADALTLIGALPTSLPLAHTVITPHPGEAGRLLGSAAEQVQGDRYRAAQQLAEHTGGVVVLKGAGTIVQGDGPGIVCTAGTPYLATAGAGDVLSGVVAALIAQGLSLFDAAVLGVLAHAQAGERAHRVHGGPIVASDLLNEIPPVIGALTHGP